MRTDQLLLTAVAATRPVMNTTPLTVHDYLFLCGAGLLAIVVSILKDDQINARTATSEAIMGILVSIVFVPWVMIKFHYDLNTGLLLAAGINIILRKIWPLVENVMIDRIKKLTKKI